MRHTNYLLLISLFVIIPVDGSISETPEIIIHGRQPSPAVHIQEKSSERFISDIVKYIRSKISCKGSQLHDNSANNQQLPGTSSRTSKFSGNRLFRAGWRIARTRVTALAIMKAAQMLEFELPSYTLWALAYSISSALYGATIAKIMTRQTISYLIKSTAEQLAEVHGGNSLFYRLILGSISPFFEQLTDNSQNINDCTERGENTQLLVHEISIEGINSWDVNGAVKQHLEKLKESLDFDNFISYFLFNWAGAIYKVATFFSQDRFARLVQVPLQQLHREKQLDYLKHVIINSYIAAAPKEVRLAATAILTTLVFEMLEAYLSPKSDAIRVLLDRTRTDAESGRMSLQTASIESYYNEKNGEPLDIDFDNFT